MFFFTNRPSPSLIKHHDIAQPASHYPNLRLEAAHALASMQSNCPDAQQGHISDMGDYINPLFTMFQGMGMARDAKISSIVDTKSELSNGLRGVNPPPDSSKGIHSGLNNDELRSLTPPSSYSTTIHEKVNQVQGKLKGTSPPPGSSNPIHSEGLSTNGVFVLRDNTPPPSSSGSVHNINIHEVSELGKLRGNTPPHGSSKNINSGISNNELRSATPLPHSQSSKPLNPYPNDAYILKGTTPSPGSSDTIH